MTAIKLERFGGMLPAWDDHLLPDGQSAFSSNGYLFSGALIGWRQPKLLRTLVNSAAQFVYRVPLITGPNQAVDTEITGAAAWMEFNDPDTNVMRTPIVDDQFQRYYFASPSLPPQYNTYDRIVAGNAPFLLGINAPGCAPNITVTGGGTAVQVGSPNTVSAAPSAQTYGPNTIFLTPFTVNTAGLLSDVNMFTQTETDPYQIIGVLYASDPTTGLPTTLINRADPARFTGVQSASLAPAGAIGYAFTNPTALVANTKYWIGFMFGASFSFPSNNSIKVQQADDTASLSLSGTATFGNGPPPTMGALVATPDLQIWGNITSGAIQAARSYLFTWVSAYGEEGPPSPPTLLNGWANGVWQIGLFQPPASDQGTDRNLVTTRIYRTVSDQFGNTTFFFVADVPISTGTFTDASDDSIIALNNQLQTTLWFPPPSDLQGMVALPNGFAIGFRANEIWFSEPYHPHAWPPSYVLTTEFPIVGIGVNGQTAVVATRGTPYAVTGVNPASMALAKVLIPEPCISRGSIVSTDSGVVYMSLNGLIEVNQFGAATNITEQWITRDKWRQLTPSKNVRAIKLASSYFAFGTVNGSDTSVAQQGFSVELSSGDADSFTIWPQPGRHRLGFQELTAPNGFNLFNVEVDPWTAIGLLIQNGGVYYYDFSDLSPTIVPYKWRSKIYQQTAKRNFEAMRVFFTTPPGSPTQGARNVSQLQPTLGANQLGIVRVYANDADGNMVPVTTREIYSSGELLRIASGFKREMWQWEIEGRVLISNFQVATSVKELGVV